jgi:hypothetical protein
MNTVSDQYVKQTRKEFSKLVSRSHGVGFSQPSRSEIRKYQGKFLPRRAALALFQRKVRERHDGQYKSKSIARPKPHRQTHLSSLDRIDEYNALHEKLDMEAKSRARVRRTRYAAREAWKKREEREEKKWADWKSKVRKDNWEYLEELEGVMLSAPQVYEERTSGANLKSALKSSATEGPKRHIHWEDPATED